MRGVLLKMEYLVKRVNKRKKEESKTFQNMREALCYATDFREIEISKMYRNGVLFGEYRS